MKTLITFTIILTVILTACAPTTQDGSATTSVPLTVTELKYRVLEEYQDFFFCDPDFYPIAREDEMTLALQRFAEVQANAEEFQAILNHLGMSGQSSFTDEQKLSIYREHKRLNAVYFESVGKKYKFQIQTGTEGQEGYIIKGTIDSSGKIDVEERTQGFPMCPICLAAGTLIETPRGAVSVEDIKVGDQVWTKNEAGERVIGVVLQVGSVRVPDTHQIVHIILNDGRKLWASPGHPTADGRLIGDLKVGDVLDGAQVVLVEMQRYAGMFTFDLLPSGGTGFYWANGILLGSTLKPFGDI